MMNKFFKYIPRIAGLTVAIFMVGQLFTLIFGGTISFGLELLVTLGYTALYTFSISFGMMAVFAYLDRVFRNDRFSLKRIIVGFSASFVVSLGIIFLLRIFEEVIVENRSMAMFLQDEKPENYVFAILVTFFITLILHSFYFYKAYNENKVKEQKIIAGNASAKFESLKNQIDPHFLFNSLNVLSSLIEENPDNAQRFTTSLSKVYRYVLEQKDKELVSVEEELAFAKTYMNLLKMRFENSLFYELPEVIPDLEAKVVPLSLQLLLENTVKHNVVSEQRPLRIRIFINDNYLVIQNDFQKKEVLQDRQGVGLQNIISRYGIITRRKVLIEQNEQYFSVSIPILTKQVEAMETNYNNSESNYYKAQKRVENIKGFYGNLSSYIIVIIGLAILNLITSPHNLWFFFPAIGWGIGVLVHGLNAFDYMPFLGKDWEEKKIKELMDKEKLAKWK